MGDIGDLGMWERESDEDPDSEEVPRRGRRLWRRDVRRQARKEERSHRRKRNKQRKAPLTAEEQAYKRARKRANLKGSFFAHFVAYMSTMVLLLVATRSIRVVLIVAAAWGIALALHYFGAVIVPDLRARWIDQELGRNVRPKVDAEKRVVEERKYRSLEDLSASIAHEIRNPVTAAKSLVQQMGEDPMSGENVDYARTALGELDRVERSISHLLRYARDEALQLETLDIAYVVESALETFRARVNRDSVRIDRDLDAAGFVRGDGEKLRRVVINLIANGLDAMSDAGTTDPVLRISAGENLAGTEAWVRVRDNGPGMDAETRRQIFDPFYTTKDEGTGLGLALSKKLVEAHAGSLEVESEPGLGTEFILVVPRNPEAADGGAETANARNEGGRR
jgi:signal transduction histidine kinase